MGLRLRTKPEQVSAFERKCIKQGEGGGGDIVQKVGYESMVHILQKQKDGLESKDSFFAEKHIS